MAPNSTKSQSKGDLGVKYQESPKLKNVFKNYARAICSFILSEISTPYLSKIAEEICFKEQDFRRYITEKKDGIKGIVELRGLLVVDIKHTVELVCFKRVFQRIAEIFIKYFASNWICSSKLEYKLDYLKFRHRLLKRIRNPASLTSQKI